MGEPAIFRGVGAGNCQSFVWQLLDVRYNPQPSIHELSEDSGDSQYAVVGRLLRACVNVVERDLHDRLSASSR